jgi:hypothetical protein
LPLLRYEVDKLSNVDHPIALGLEIAHLLFKSLAPKIMRPVGCDARL